MERRDYSMESVGVSYGNRTRVAAVKEKRFVGIQGNLRHGKHRKVVQGTLRTRYWTLNGRVIGELEPRYSVHCGNRRCRHFVDAE